jgi:xylan 1,4-beta-xylosidase
VRALDDATAVPEEVDVMAARSDDGRVGVLVWRHDDNQHRQALDERPVAVNVRGLEGSAVSVQEWRVDATHANSYRSWRSLGAPDYPTAAQIQRMALDGRLVPTFAGRWELPAGGEVTVPVSLPLPSVSLLEIVPEGA